ncbi:MAG: polysaccharide deacetylase family protein [Pseudomonadota bacterium]
MRCFTAAALAVFAACSSPGTGADPAPPPESPGTELPLNIRNLEHFQQLVRAGIPALDEPLSSALADGEKGVYLTFDDGPRPVSTERILDVLDKEGVKATFFVIGWKAEKHPGIVREIAGRGHTLGNHTYDHIMPWAGNFNKYVDNAVKGREAVEKAAGVDVPLFRPPGGSLRLIDRLEEKGMKVVLWTTLSGDCAQGKPPDYLIHLVKLQEQKRPVFHRPMVILMHDTHEHTALALPDIIAYLKKKGFRFLSEWM